MVTGSDQAPGALPEPPRAGTWEEADATLLASSLFSFAPAFAASIWLVWVKFATDPFGEL